MVKKFITGNLSYNLEVAPQAVVLRQHAASPDLTMQNIPRPICPPQAVLVRVLAAALNHLDLFVCRGWPGLNLQFPHILGSDACGEVIAIGSKIKASQRQHIRCGDKVMLNSAIACGRCEFCRQHNSALCAKLRIMGEDLPGTYAHYIAVPPAQLHKLPKHLDPIQGAALTLTYLTAWRMLVTQAQLKKGETVLIQGIGGGVALAALQLAKAMGAHVWVTSRSTSKLAAAKKLGAQQGFSSNDHYVEVIRQLTKKRGVDVVVESVGQASWEKSLACLRRGGRLVTCGATTGNRATTDLARLFWNQLQIFGSTMGSVQECRAMYRFVTQHKLKPQIDQIFPYQQFNTAFARLQSGEQMGKIVLDFTQNS